MFFYGERQKIFQTECIRSQIYAGIIIWNVQPTFLVLLLTNILTSLILKLFKGTEMDFKFGKHILRLGYHDF